MTDFADDSNISLNAFDEQNADKNALNGKNGNNEYNDNDMTNDSKTDEESDAREDRLNKLEVIPSKANDDEDRKLFIGGLSWDTDENDLREYFKKYGNVTDVSIKYDAVSGNPRGFGFITFASEESIEDILKTGPHIIKNKPTDPKRAKSRPICKKIFVGGIDSNMSEEEIKKYFSKYGVVEGIELPFDRQRNRRREFCFIIFDTEEAAELAVKEAKQTIGNKECDIKKAQPQPVAQQQKRMQQQTAYDGYDSGAVTARRGRGRNQDNYQSQSNWSGYNGAVPQNYYGNYYGNQYPNAYGYPNQNYDYYSQYGYSYGDYWNYYGYGDQSAVTQDAYGTTPAVADTTAAYGTTTPSQPTSHTHSHHNSASGSAVAGKMPRKSGTSSNYHPYRSSTQH